MIESGSLSRATQRTPGLARDLYSLECYLKHQSLDPIWIKVRGVTTHRALGNNKHGNFRVGPGAIVTLEAPVIVDGSGMPPKGVNGYEKHRIASFVLGEDGELRLVPNISENRA